MTTNTATLNSTQIVVPGVGDEIGICECCEQEKNLTRHHVVPYAFSKHFPNKTFPDNRLMLCRDCHDLVEIDLRKFRKFFRGRLGITVDEIKQTDEHIRYKRAKAFAWQLVSNHTNIPTQKIMEMTLFVHELYPDAHTYEDFRKIARDESKIRATRTDPYGKLVSDRVQELGMEEWFWSVWSKKNTAIIKKLRAKGVEEERIRRRRNRHRAPEGTAEDVVEMLMHNESMSTDEANDFYQRQDTETKKSLRRCAYSWIRKTMKRTGVRQEASKDDTCRYIADVFQITLETAGEMYRLSSKRKKKSYRKQAYETIRKHQLDNGVFA